MLPTIDLLNCDLRNIARSSQDEIRMVDAVLAAIRHPNNEWLEWLRLEELANSCLHDSHHSQRFTRCPGHRGVRRPNKHG